MANRVLSAGGHRLVHMARQRLSQRMGKAEPDGPYEGVPEHIFTSIVYWFQGLAGYEAPVATSLPGGCRSFGHGYECLRVEHTASRLWIV
jgi:hypothetical protein